MGGFLGAALASERKILDAYTEAFERMEANYAAAEGLRMERIIKNHAQIAACGEALAVLFPDMQGHLQEGLTEYLYLRAKSREQRLAADHPLIEQFWEVFEYMSNARHKGEGSVLDHSTNPDILAINLNHFRELAQSAGQPIIDLQQVKKLLPHTRRFKFIEANRTVRSCILDKPIKCWVFQRKP